MSRPVVDWPESNPTLHVPRPLLAGAGLLVLAAVTLTALGRPAPGALVAAATADPAVQERTVAFTESADGTVRVTDPRTGVTLRTLAAGEGGFMRGMLRPLNRERSRVGVPLDASLVLSARASGVLLLVDPQTGLVVDLDAFGSSSRAQFEPLLGAVPDRP